MTEIIQIDPKHPMPNDIERAVAYLRRLMAEPYVK